MFRLYEITWLETVNGKTGRVHDYALDMDRAMRVVEWAREVRANAVKVEDVKVHAPYCGCDRCRPQTAEVADNEES